MTDTTATLDKFAAGDLLRCRREERGLTQEQVVDNTAVPVAAYLSELENGKVNVARSKHFASLAAFLNLSEDDIRSINPAAVFERQPPSKTLTDYRKALPEASQTWIAKRISERLGEQVGQQAISYWENGRVDLRNVHPRRLQAYADVLGITLTELAVAAGYDVEDLRGAVAPKAGAGQAEQPVQGLLEAAKMFGDEVPALRDPSWQAYLMSFRFSKSKEDRTPLEWLELCRALERMDVVPQVPQTVEF